MKAPIRTHVRSLMLAAATMAATAVVVIPVATAQSTSPSSPQAAQTPRPQMVVGLPDFSQLVEQVGPGVVNIEAVVSPHAQPAAQMQGEDQLPEMFRRFFGPGMPGMPGMPGQPEQQAPGTAIGSGFIISNDGYVLTNHHVVDGADEVKVRLSDRREFTAKVVGSDEQSDIALLKINASHLPALHLGDSRQLKPGQWVVAIGSPFGLDHSVTAGIVSAVGRANPYADQRYVPFIQTDVAINRGNSGGPLLNTRGEVVGINSQIFSNSGGYMGVSFAIPIDTAMGAVQQLKATGKVSRGQIGVQVQQIDYEKAKGLGLPDTRGALVAAVVDGSPAQQGGIEVGDVIRAFNGMPINDSSDLPPLVGAMTPGSHAKVTVLRGDRTRDFDLVLGTLDESVADTTAQPTPSRHQAAAGNPLGLVGEALDANDRKQLGLDPGQGVGISRVEGLAARSAGLRPGDIVLKVGRDVVGTPADLDRALAGVRAGQTVMLLVRRDASTQFVAVTPREDGTRQ